MQYNFDIFSIMSTLGTLRPDSYLLSVSGLIPRSFAACRWVSPAFTRAALIVIFSICRLSPFLNGVLHIGVACRLKDCTVMALDASRLLARHGVTPNFLQPDIGG